MYLQLEQLLKKVARKEDEFAYIDDNLVHAVKAGIEKFNKYNEYIKKNMIYFISLVLDPRVKTRWIKKNVENPGDPIESIHQFLKDTYPVEAPESRPLASSSSQHRSLEYEFLEEYADSPNDAPSNDIDKYFNSDPIRFVLNEGEDQTQWLLNWWAAHI